jgi:beta-ribofuranosylaminobenzene 5'-phosphate synthase
MTLIDLNAEIGRMDGGIGLALEKPYFEISLEKNDELIVEGDERERASNAANRVFEYFGEKRRAKITIEKSYKPHVGLGSGTQLSLGVGIGIAKLLKIQVSPREIANISDRGGTSGIGVAAFETGGFILDGGHSTREKKDFLPSSASDAPPSPVLARYDFPDWKIAIVNPKGKEIYGKSEIDVFKRRCPIPLEEVRKLSHTILMKTLPSLVEEDLETFGESINDIQETGFKKIEVELQKPLVRDILKKCQRNSFGAGLSSFGPTIYCFVEDEDKLREALGGEADILVTKANNIGAKFIY